MHIIVQVTGIEPTSQVWKTHTLNRCAIPALKLFSQLLPLKDSNPHLRNQNPQ